MVTFDPKHQRDTNDRAMHKLALTLSSIPADLFPIFTQTFPNKKPNHSEARQAPTSEHTEP